MIEIISGIAFNTTKSIKNIITIYKQFIIETLEIDPNFNDFVKHTADIV